MVWPAAVSSGVGGANVGGGVARAVAARDRTSEYFWDHNKAKIVKVGNYKAKIDVTKIELNHLKGSDSAPSLCRDFGLLALGQPERDLVEFYFATSVN